MTKVAIWCRHSGDNIIGIGNEIPWDVPSDVKKFVRIVTGQNVVVGRKTYETLSGRTLPDAKIFILSSNNMYEISDKKSHQIISDLRYFKDFEDDLYIAGGASVYEAFFTSQPKLLPDIVVDCVYDGKIKSGLTGEKADISSCINVMNQKFIKASTDFELDQVRTAIYIKRGEFVDQAVLKSLLADIEG